MLPSTLGVRARKCDDDDNCMCGHAMKASSKKKKKRIQGLREPGHAKFTKMPMDINAINASLTAANS